jgi:hypothetical protein
VKETIQLGNGVEIEAGNVVRIADRRAATATAEQLTVGEKYRREKAEKAAKREADRHAEILRAPVPRGELLERLKMQGQVIDANQQALANTIFMLQSLVRFLSENGTTACSIPAKDEGGGMILAHRINVTEWEKFYEAEREAENARVQAAKRAKMIDAINVDAWRNASPNFGLIEQVMPAAGEEFAATIKDGDTVYTTKAATAKEAIYKAMEEDHARHVAAAKTKADQARAQAPAEPVAVTDRRAGAEACDGCGSADACQKNGGPLCGDDAVPPDVRAKMDADRDAAEKAMDVAGPPCAGQETTGPKTGGAE